LADARKPHGYAGQLCRDGRRCAWRAPLGAPRRGSADQPLSCSERGAFYSPALEVSGESGVVELAVVEQHVCVGVGGDRERALADAGADQRPGLALAVPKADAAVAQVVWATTWACRRLCRRVRWRCAAALG